MLLLVLLLHNVLAHDFQKDATYSVNVAETCPDDGYYYKEELSSNEVDAGTCRLCFCKNNTAVCWLRPTVQCHTKIYNKIDKRAGRNRRSPEANIGIKYAVKNFFSKRKSHSCRPRGTTLSDDCPPDDWCLGCTVCDCERSGHWNCHVLSFCSDRKLKKHFQTNNNTIKRTPVQIHSNLDNQNLMNTTKMHRLARKLNVNHNNVKSWRQEFSTTNQYPYLPKHDDNVVVFKKDLVERKSKDIQSVRIKKILNENNVNVRLSHKVVQRAMAAVHKIINKTERNFTNSTKHKVIHKRSMPQYDSKNSYQTTYVSPHMYKKSSPKRFRKKLSLNKITKEELGKKRIRRNTVTTHTLHGNFSSTTAKSDCNTTSTSSQDKVQNKTTLQLNEYDYYKYNVVTDRTFDLEQNNGIKLKHLSYNYTYGNKTLKLLKKTSQNLTGVNLCSSSDEFNLSIWRDVKDKRQKFKSINITDIKYLTTSEKVNNSLDYNQINLQKGSNKIRFDELVDGGDENDRKLSDTEDFNLINNMLNSKGILQHVFKKQPRNISRNKNTGRNFDLIRNLKSLFNKIFFRSKNGFYITNDKLKLFDKQNILETFCVKNVTCKIHPRDEIKLQIKINELNGEMYKVMETIKIIKKLLQEMINNKMEVVDINFKPNLSNNCSKNNSQNKTEARQLQMYYIKDSIKTFIKSIGKFSYILQDILYILTDKKNVTNNKQNSPHRPLRWTKMNEISKSNSKNGAAEQKFKKIKKVLINYNLLQNTFMKKIYEMLTKLETNLTRTEKKRKIKKPDKFENKDLSTTLAIETFTNNIITNLRKLKNLAKKLSSATTNRRKRSTLGDDDAIEYLLTIMEYLLKQNYPLDAAPVNDGIDLLIDAIKHAPDIKPIKKKVLDVSTTKAYDTWTTEKLTAETYSYVDNIYGMDSLDKDNNDTSNSDNNQIIFSKSADDGNDKIEDFQKLLHASKKISNSFRLSNFNSILKNAKLKSKATTSAPIVTTTPLIQYDFLKDNMAESDTETSRKIGQGVGNYDRNYVADTFKVFNNEHKNGDNEEYPPILTKLDAEGEIQATLPTRTVATARTTRKFHHMVREKFDNPKIIVYNGKPLKSKFGWVEYDQSDDGRKKIERKSFSKSTERTTAPVTSKKQIIPTFDKNDVSTISKELMDEEKRKQFYKLLPNSEFRKLTSDNMLEYATVKSELDSDSKDAEGEDTYVNDVFPSYLT